MKTWAGAVSGRGMSHGSVRVLGVLPMAVASFGVPFGVLGRCSWRASVCVCVCVCVSPHGLRPRAGAACTPAERKKEKKKRVGWARILSPAAGRLATRNAQHMSRLRRHPRGGFPHSSPYGPGSARAGCFSLGLAGAESSPRGVSCRRRRPTHCSFDLQG